MKTKKLQATVKGKNIAAESDFELTPRLQKQEAISADRRIYDQAFAEEISRTSEEKWRKTGADIHRPYREGTYSTAEVYRLYCKGLVKEEIIGASEKCWMVTGKSLPIQGIMTTLVGKINRRQNKFSYCGISHVLQKDIKFASKLANEAILSQLTLSTERSGKRLKRTCSICLEGIYASHMYSIKGCQHSYCWSCIKKHTEVQLFQGKLPKCPQGGCTTVLKIESCKEFFTPEVYDKLKQRLKEATIPPSEKICCPYSRCSVLMTKSEALARTNNSGASECVKCRRLFCMKCKVLWHKYMKCNDYKKLYPFPCEEDAKLNSLANKKQWRQCAICRSIVELAGGCFHISCRCGHEFCYTCGAQRKEKKATCKCPTWDECNIVYNRNRN